MKAAIHFKKSATPASLTIAIETENPKVHVEIKTDAGATKEAFSAAVRLAWVCANEINPEDALTAFQKVNAELESRKAA